MTSISFHIGGNSTGNVAIEHNNRTFKKHKNRDIDTSKSAQNIQFKKSKSVKAAYNQIFEPYTEKYDQKQKRKDRKIGNYYEHLSNQKGGKGGQKDRNLVYESISTIGKADFENGKPKPLTQKELDFKKKVLKKAEEGWSEAHPNMVVINSVMHLDESNPHIHRDFVPVFHSKTGQELQVSLNKAISEELGVAARRVPVRKLNKETRKYEQVFYKNGKPKIKLDNKANFKLWSERERDRIAKIARTIDPNFQRTKTDEVDHQSIAEYKEIQASKNLEESENLKTKLKRERVDDVEKTALTQADFIKKLMPNYPIASFSSLGTNERLETLNKALIHQNKFNNCKIIREYEPEGQIQKVQKDSQGKTVTSLSEPIKTEIGFNAFMQQPLDWLRDAKEKYKKIFQKKLKDLKDIIKNQDLKIKKMVDDIEIKNQTISELKADKTKLSNDLDHSNKERSILKSKVDEAYDYLDKFDAKTKRMTHNIKIKNQTISDLKTDKTKLSTDLENTKNENNQLKADKTKLSSDLENSKNENKQLKDELDESLQKNDLYLTNMRSERKKFKQKNNIQEQEQLTKPIERDENGLSRAQRHIIDDGNQILRDHGLGEVQMGYNGQTLRENEAEQNHKVVKPLKLSVKQVDTVLAATDKYLTAGLPSYSIDFEGFSNKYDLKLRKQKLAENQAVQAKKQQAQQQQAKKKPVFKQSERLKIEHPHNNQKQKRNHGMSR
ncbi:plasmid recombination protein [Fructilactobacillus sanfranciscensis]